MSLYLGKIHYWLFNKILWFDGLESEVIHIAQEEGLDVKFMEKEITLKYGDKIPNKDLKDIIDTANIHGWLQSKIHCAEGRMAAWTKFIISQDNTLLSRLENLYISQGIKAAKEVKASGSVITAKEIYNSINDYILDGMPCDRVNEVITLEDEKVEWKRKSCVHRELWEGEGLQVETFYNLRHLWIKAFVNEVNSNFQFNEKNKGEYEITLR